MIRRVLQFARSRLSQLGYAVHPIDKNFESDQVALCKSLAMTNVFDVGANVGKVAERYRNLFPSSNLTLIEPIPEFAERLRRNFAGAKVVQAALSDKNGIAEFNLASAKDTSSLLQPDINMLPKSYRSTMISDRIEIVDTIRLDDFCQQNGVEHINLMKLDLQGGELKALQGAERLLEKNSIDIICTEAFLLPFYKGSPLFDDLVRFLGHYGYIVHGIYNPAVSGRTGRIQWIDAIFVAPHLLAHSKDLQIKSIIGGSDRI